MGLRARTNWYVISTILDHECIRWKLRKEYGVRLGLGFWVFFDARA